MFLCFLYKKNALEHMFVVMSGISAGCAKRLLTRGIFTHVLMFSTCKKTCSDAFLL